MVKEDKDIRYSIIVPVFNSHQTLKTLHDRIVKVMEKNSHNYEILMVDDGSIDSSWEVISALVNESENLTGIQLMRNYGQAGATMAGFREAVGQYLITIDDDLQNPPEEIQKLIDYIEHHEEVDAVIGAPREKRHSAGRKLGSQVINLISNRMFMKDKTFKLTGFRIVRREVALPLLELNISNPAPGALLNTITPRMVNIEVEHEPRSAGKSGYTFMKLFNLTVDKFLGFSTLPLRFMALTGLLGVALSGIMGLILLIKFFTGQITVPGWTTLTLLLIIIAGFIFMGFGIVGEYLHQILLSVRNTPQYLIRSKVTKKDAD